jgi:hypothetical protein
LREILRLEHIKSKIIWREDQLDCFIPIQSIWALWRGLLHADAQIEELHWNVWVTHQLLLRALETFGGDANLFKHSLRAGFISFLLLLDITFKRTQVLLGIFSKVLASLLLC